MAELTDRENQLQRRRDLTERRAQNARMQTDILSTDGSVVSRHPGLIPPLVAAPRSVNTPLTPFDAPSSAVVSNRPAGHRSADTHWIPTSSTPIRSRPAREGLGTSARSHRRSAGPAGLTRVAGIAPLSQGILPPTYETVFPGVSTTAPGPAHLTPPPDV